MTQEENNRANKLAAESKGNIKAKRLLSVGTGISGGLLPNNYLHDKPILDYFDQNEQPHFFFYNESKGVGIGETRKKSGWSGDYRNSMWVTNEGLHFTVGKSSGDFHNFLPFNSIQSVTVKNGLTKNKFILETTEGQVHFPTDPSLGVSPAEDFISENISASSSAHKVNKETNALRKERKGTNTAQKGEKKTDAIRKKGKRTNSVHKKDTSVQSTGKADEISLSTLQQVDVYDFEHLIALVWEKQGWETQVTTGSTDKGVDITAVKSDPFEQRQYIQAKRYAEKNKVGSGEIQKYSGLYARNESVDAVVVVTTSQFTKEAQKVAANRNVKLINGTQLLKMIKRHNAVNNKYLADVGGVSENDSTKTSQNWAEAIDQIQANNTEEETVYDVLSKTKNTETSWPRSLTPVSDLSEVRNTLMRCINEAYEENSQGVIKWTATDFDYATVIEFSEREERTGHYGSGVEISIEIAKKANFEGEDLNIDSVSSLREKFDYNLKLHTDGSFNSVIASRNTLNDDFSISDELSTIEYIIVDLTGQTLQDISYVSVVDPAQFG